MRRSKNHRKRRVCVGTILAAILLLGVIAYGANKIRPVFEAARELHEAQVKSGSKPADGKPGECGSRKFQRESSRECQ